MRYLFLALGLLWCTQNSFADKKPTWDQTWSCFDALNSIECRIVDKDGEYTHNADCLRRANYRGGALDQGDGYWRVPQNGADNIYVRPHLTGNDASKPTLEVMTSSGVYYEVPAPVIDSTKMKPGETYKASFILIDQSLPHQEGANATTPGMYSIEFKITDKNEFDPTSIRIKGILENEKTNTIAATNIYTKPAKTRPKLLDESFGETGYSLWSTYERLKGAPSIIINLLKREMQAYKIKKNLSKADQKKINALEAKIKKKEAARDFDLAQYKKALSSLIDRKNKDSPCYGVSVGKKVLESAKEILEDKKTDSEDKNPAPSIKASKKKA